MSSDNNVYTEVPVTPDSTMFHPKTWPVDERAPLGDLLCNALLNHLTGRTEGAKYYEELAKRHSEYTTTAFWWYLIGVAKRNLFFQNSIPKAIVTLNRGLPIWMQYTPTGMAIVWLNIAMLFNEMRREEIAQEFCLVAEASLRG